MPIRWVSSVLLSDWQAITAGGAFAATIVDAGPQLNNLQGTLVRVRGMLAVNVTSAINIDGIMAAGLCVVPALAAAAGIAGNAIPRPISQADDECWLWHAYRPVRGFTQPTPADAVHGNIQIPIDSKAMRKLDDDVHVMLIIESDTTALQVSFGMRALIKLP